MSFPATKTARTGVSGRLDESSTKVHRKCTDETVSRIAGHRKVPALKNLPEGFSRGFPMEMPGSSWTPRRFVTPWKARTPMEGSGFRDPIGDSATLSGASISAGGCRRADHVMPDGHGPSASSARSPLIHRMLWPATPSPQRGYDAEARRSVGRREDAYVRMMGGDLQEAADLPFSGNRVAFVYTEPDSAYSVVEWVAAPGAPGTPLHLHRATDEAFYVLEGTLGFQVGQRTLELRAFHEKAISVKPTVAAVTVLKEPRRLRPGACFHPPCRWVGLLVTLCMMRSVRT